MPLVMKGEGRSATLQSAEAPSAIDLIDRANLPRLSPFTVTTAHDLALGRPSAAPLRHLLAVDARLRS